MNVRPHVERIEEFEEVIREGALCVPDALLQLSEAGSKEVEADCIAFLALPLRYVEDHQPSNTIGAR